MMIASHLKEGVFALMLVGGSFSTGFAVAKEFRASLPLDCVAQKTCFIQNYVDVDPSRAVRDYTCGKSSYDGHKGVDFRIISIAQMKKGVRVKAVAQGVVKALREGMADRLVSASAAEYLKGRECGNGLVIAHQGGWQSQYCHMRRGSLKVKPGDRVERGQVLGLVGLSGKTAFPHLHLSLRHKGRVVDPFSGVDLDKGACKLRGTPLFEARVLKDFPHQSGQPFVMGFTTQALKKGMLLAKGKLAPPKSIKARALVFYGMALNLLKGDQLGFELSGPQGVLAKTLTRPMNRHKAEYYGFVGKKRRATAWPAGTYQGVFKLMRGGRVIWRKTQSLELR